MASEPNISGRDLRSPVDVELPPAKCCLPLTFEMFNVHGLCACTLRSKGCLCLYLSLASSPGWQSMPHVL